jgi:hypothetical protein
MSVSQFSKLKPLKSLSYLHREHKETFEINSKHLIPQEIPKIEIKIK